MLGGFFGKSEPWVFNLDCLPINTPSAEAAFLNDLYCRQLIAISRYSANQPYELLGRTVVFSDDIILRPRKKNASYARLTIIEFPLIGDGRSAKVQATRSLCLLPHPWGGYTFVHAKHPLVLKERVRQEGEIIAGFQRLVRREVDISNHAGLKTKPAFFDKQAHSGFILQRRAPGVTFDRLRQRMRAEPMPVVTYFNIAIESLRELHRLHENVKILHADINEGNVMVDVEQHPPKVTFIDYERARREADPYPYTGHPAFTPPESRFITGVTQTSVYKNTRASDVFALGRVLHLLCGGVPTPSPSYSMIMSTQYLKDVTPEDNLKIRIMLRGLTDIDPDHRCAPLAMAEIVEEYLQIKLRMQTVTYGIGGF